MNIVNIMIILFILMCIITGFKRGIIRESINVVGNFLIIIISFMLMGNVGNFLCQHLPFLTTGLLGISLSSLNILLYQIIAFALIFFILSFVFKLILTLTKIVDKLINSLLIFHTTSSILGGIVGFFGGYITVFVILLVVSVPLANNSTLHNSIGNTIILKKTPILTGLTAPISNATNDIYNVTVKIAQDPNKLQNSNQYNLEILDIMLKYNVVSIDEIDTLISQNKLNDIKNVNNILQKYR